MTISDNTKLFLSDDSGAVTVDWVVLTAAIVGLGIAVLSSVGGGITGQSDLVEGRLTHMADDLATGYPLHQ
ncbi:MAG: hypothetical protein ACU0CA_16155 [Paracoccaceae bacterium]